MVPSVLCITERCSALSASTYKAEKKHRFTRTGFPSIIYSEFSNEKSYRILKGLGQGIISHTLSVLDLSSFPQWRDVRAILLIMQHALQASKTDDVDLKATVRQAKNAIEAKKVARVIKVTLPSKKTTKNMGIFSRHTW